MRCWSMLCTRTMHRECTICDSSVVWCSKSAAIRIFEHINALLAQIFACMVHFRARRLRIAPIFGHRYVRSQPITVRELTSRLTDGDHRTCFLLKNRWSARRLLNRHLLPNGDGTLAKDPTSFARRFELPEPVESCACVKQRNELHRCRMALHIACTDALNPKLW